MSSFTEHIERDALRGVAHLLPRRGGAPRLYLRSLEFGDEQVNPGRPLRHPFSPPRGIAAR
jgi:hypothetical protein